MVSLVLTAIGLLLLVISFAGGALGLYMAADMRTRRRGQLVTMLWVPATSRIKRYPDARRRDVRGWPDLLPGSRNRLRPARRHARRATSQQKGRLGQRPRGKQIPRLREEHQRERSERPGQSSFLKGAMRLSARSGIAFACQHYSFLPLPSVACQHFGRLAK